MYITIKKCIDNVQKCQVKPKKLSSDNRDHVTLFLNDPAMTPR